MVLALPLRPHPHGVGGAGLERGRALGCLCGCWTENTGTGSALLWECSFSSARCGAAAVTGQEFLPQEFRCLLWDRTKRIPEGFVASQSALKWFKIHLLGGPQLSQAGRDPQGP